MPRRPQTALVIVLCAVACLLAASPAVAKTRHFNETLRSASISTAGNFPAIGSTQLNATTIAGRSFGPGAQINRVVVTGLPTPNTIAFKVTGTDFFAAGTQRWKATGTATVQADGSITNSGKGSYTGGTLRYRRSRGTFTFSGVQASGSTITVFTSSGTIRY